ncbi:UNVERIFIED_CONTAM: Protein tssc1 [Siphonaria sp. JEL0065]|nr:Protein tssc1 [Siphonaria sp. JEL0065]
MSFTLPHQARCIVPQLAEQDRPRFFAGTTSVFGGVAADNELRLLDYDEEENEISSQTFSHPNQVRFIAPSPDKSDFVFTCHHNHTANPNPRASLWLLSALATDEDNQKLANQAGTLSELLCIESCEQVKGINKIFWEPSGGKSRVIATGTTSVGVYGIDRGLSKGTLGSVYSLSSITGLTSPADYIDCAKWNPHNPEEFTIGAESTLIGLDTRTPATTTTFIIPYAHDQCIRDLDYNPNKPYHLATGGNDGKVRIWDSRNHSKPLKELNDHSHWVWSVNYNRFHDQLLLSSSSDCLVNLQNVVSVSSTPYGLIRSMDEELDVVREEGLMEEIKTTDELIATYKEFEDSVYSVCWSSADPWVFASLSFDGRVYINVVPKDVKYSIIL